MAIASRFKLGPIFTPPVVSKADGPIATLTRGPTNGGTNWPGGAFDPETHMFYVAASNAAPSCSDSCSRAKDRSDMNWMLGIAPQPTARAAVSPCKGLSIFKPPYGTISAINLDKGEIAWQVPHGETPDAVRNHEALKGMTIPRTGQPGFIVGTLVTKTLVIAGDPQVTTPPTRRAARCCAPTTRRRAPRSDAVLLPAPVSGSPMTYAVNGKQYIVVAVSGGPYSGEFIALRLPDAK